MYEDECPICFEKLPVCDRVITKCSHKFCAECILQYLLYRTDCPMCRTIINRSEFLDAIHSDNPNTHLLKKQVWIDIHHPHPQIEPEFGHIYMLGRIHVVFMSYGFVLVLMYTLYCMIHVLEYELANGDDTVDEYPE